MIYTIGGIKGGTGKTTLAVNLAVALSMKNRDILLIDSDDQESATEFTSWREETLGSNSIGYTAVQMHGLNLRTQVLSLVKKYEDIVIDTGGRDTSSQRAALLSSDVALFPFSPRSLDIWTVKKLSILLNDIFSVNSNLKAYCFLNKADHRGTDNRDAENLLKNVEHIQYLSAFIRNRKIFANSVSAGLSILEYSPQDSKATNEFHELLNMIDWFSNKKD